MHKRNIHHSLSAVILTENAGAIFSQDDMKEYVIKRAARYSPLTDRNLICGEKKLVKF